MCVFLSAVRGMQGYIYLEKMRDERVRETHQALPGVQFRRSTLWIADALCNLMAYDTLTRSFLRLVDLALAKQDAEGPSSAHVQHLSSVVTRHSETQ